MRRRIAVIMKNHGGDIYFTLFNVPYFKPRDSYVYNVCRFKKKRKLTFHHLFLIALYLELVLTKPSGKRLPALFNSKIGLGTFCSPKMKIKYFFGFCLFPICPFQILNSLKQNFDSYIIYSSIFMIQLYFCHVCEVLSCD